MALIDNIELREVFSFGGEQSATIQYELENTSSNEIAVDVTYTKNGETVTDSNGNTRQVDASLTQLTSEQFEANFSFNNDQDIQPTLCVVVSNATQV